MSFVNLSQGLIYNASTFDVAPPETPAVGQWMVIVASSEDAVSISMPSEWKDRSHNGLYIWLKKVVDGVDNIPAQTYGISKVSYPYGWYGAYIFALYEQENEPFIELSGVGLGQIDNLAVYPAMETGRPEVLVIARAALVGGVPAAPSNMTRRAIQAMPLNAGINLWFHDAGPVSSGTVFGIYGIPNSGLSSAVYTILSFGDPLTDPNLVPGAGLISLSISEDIAGFVDSKLTLRMAKNEVLDPKKRHSVGTNLAPTSPVRRFFIQTALPKLDGVREYQGETLLSRMSRIYPKNSDLLIKRAPPRPAGDPHAGERWWYPEEVMTLVLQGFSAVLSLLEFEPLPVMGFRDVSDAIVRPKIEGIAMYNPNSQTVDAGENQVRKTMREWLDDLTRPFQWAGYFWRENSAGKLELVAPYWATAASPKALSNNEVGIGFEPSDQNSSVINRVTVKSQGYDWVGENDVLQKTAITFWPYYTPGEGGNGSGGRGDWPNDPPAVDVSIEQSYLYRPFVTTVGSNTYVNPVDDTESLLIDSPNIISDDGLLLNIEIQRWKYAKKIDEYVQLSSLTKTINGLPRGVETYLGEFGGDWGGTILYPFPASYVSLQLWATRVTDTGITFRIKGDLSNDYLASYGVEQVQYGIRIILTADGQSYQIGNTKNEATAGDAETFPDFDALKAEYGVIEREYDTGIYQLSGSDCLNIARGVVRENYRPRPVWAFDLMGPYQLSPDDLGKAITHPAGVTGVLEHWGYDEQNTPGSSESSASVTIREIPT